jgi:hypothetical protein
VSKVSSPPGHEYSLEVREHGGPFVVRQKASREVIGATSNVSRGRSADVPRIHETLSPPGLARAIARKDGFASTPVTEGPPSAMATVSRPGQQPRSTTYDPPPRFRQTRVEMLTGPGRAGRRP